MICMPTIRIVVSGLVQGVGFRAFVRRNALALSLTGEVWNRLDGQVEAAVSGTADHLESLEAVLYQGPGRVDAIELSSLPDQDFASFRIRPGKL